MNMIQTQTCDSDLNPLKDSDGNGNLLDDPDYTGSRADINFDSAGTNTVIVTVFDISNNSDSHTFSVIVSEAEVEEADYAIFVVVIFAGLVTMSIALIGYRRWQSTIALKLLMDRGYQKTKPFLTWQWLSKLNSSLFLQKQFKLQVLLQEPKSYRNSNNKWHKKRLNSSRFTGLQTNMK